MTGEKEENEFDNLTYGDEQQKNENGEEYIDDYYDEEAEEIEDISGQNSVDSRLEEVV